MAVPLSAALDLVGLSRPPWLLGVDLAVRPGEAVGLLGANGAGKSTLLLAVAGLRRAQGTVRIAGAEGAAARAELGLAGELHAVGRTVRQLLALVVATHGRGDVDAVRDRLRLPEGPVDRLSSGERRRVALACAVVHAPAVVLLDEPLTHLDAAGQGLVRTLIAEERSRGAALLVATHHPDALPLDRTVTLAEGRLC